MPVLIVRGMRSTSFHAATARQMLETLSGAALVELDAAHNVALDQPKALADAVVDFAREAEV
jgi:pimeloyl-ACP methyl ester carboxylesterase